MTAEIYAMAAGEFFKAVNTIASKIPEFDEKKKEAIENQTEVYLMTEKRFIDYAVSFNENSRSDELLGLSRVKQAEEAKLKSLIVLYAREIQGGAK